MLRLKTGTLSVPADYLEHPPLAREQYGRRYPMLGLMREQLILRAAAVENVLVEIQDLFGRVLQRRQCQAAAEG
jgi:hypothetical protein